MTALHEWHVVRGARMAVFAGYDMPIFYPTGAVEEHHACRRSVGLFDIAHMGRVEISGRDAETFLSHLVSSSIRDLTEFQARYALLLNEEGGILDDLFIYRLRDRWLVVVNASNRDSDLEWMRSRAPSGLDIVDRSEELYMIAVQGPRALELADRLCGGAASRVPRFSSAEIALGGIRVLFGRTGYTGEDGGELFFDSQRALDVWNLLLDEAARASIETLPIGLAARDSLRFEAGMPLYGHEISAQVNPIEAGLGWACDLSKEFVGGDAVKRAMAGTVRRRLVCLTLSEGLPREGYEVVTNDAGGNPRSVGRCVSGMFCPTLGLYAANAFVDSEFSAVGTELGVVIRDRPRPARVVKRPLYVPVYRRRQAV
jgi:glycine cleavage system T protein